jgi:predicted ATPase
VREAELTVTLEKLVDNDLLLVDGVAPDSTSRFKHALIQEASYESMLRSRRHEIHAEIAEALVRLQPTIVETAPETVATHLARAGDDGWAREILAKGRAARTEELRLPGGDRRLSKRLAAHE